MDLVPDFQVFLTCVLRERDEIKSEFMHEKAKVSVNSLFKDTHSEGGNCDL